VQDTEQDYEKEKLQERIARLSGGVAIIQVSNGDAGFYAFLALD
jgi:O-acetylhomoserine/O-acetylserine sulfhydrylase-like pyridoxal-dependent enzyme